jgi:hypothetical protein
LKYFGLVEVLDEPVLEAQEVEDLGRQRRFLQGREVRLAMLADVHRRDAVVTPAGWVTNLSASAASEPA